MRYLPETAKIVFYPKPVNLHKGFDSLAHIAKAELGIELVDDLFVVFRNRRKDRIKILFLDDKNLSLLAMRFDQTLKSKYDEMVIFDKKAFINFLNQTVKRNRPQKFKISEN